MESIYVLEPGAGLRREGESLRVMKNGAEIDRIPADGLKKLMLVGWISLTGAVLDFLIKNRVETVFVTPTGRFRARLMLDEHKHVELRKAQYAVLGGSSGALAAARKLVAGKLCNLADFLRLRAKTHADDTLKIDALKLKSMADHAADVGNLDILRGLEGAGTRIYFSAFPRLIRNPDFTFAGRNRRPPRDPVNALLSFVYTLLTNEVLSAVTISGLDPYLGALHEIAYGRPSLACDLVEEYRAFMGDRLVLGLINRKLIQRGDFIIRPDAPKTFVDETEMAEKRPVEMKPAVARTFIAAYEEMMRRTIHYPPLDKSVTYRGLVLNQVRRLGESLTQPDQAYEPFSWRI